MSRLGSAFFAAVAAVSVAAGAGSCTEEARAPVARKGPGQAAPRPLELLIQSCLDSKTTFLTFRPVARHLSKQTGMPFKLISAPTDDVFHKRLSTAAVTFHDSFSAYVHHTAPGRPDGFHAIAIARPMHADPKQYASILVKADSGIRQLADLKNKRFLFGSPHSATTYFATFVTLMQAGIDPRKDLRAYHFGGDCMDNAMAVFLGEADATSVCSSFVERCKENEKFNFKSDVTVIAKTIAVPSWIAKVSGELPGPLQDKVAAAFLALKPGSAIAQQALSKTRWSGFVPLEGDELTRLGELVKRYKIPIN